MVAPYHPLYNSNVLWLTKTAVVDVKLGPLFYILIQNFEKQATNYYQIKR